MEEPRKVVRFPIDAVTRLLRHSRKYPRCWPSVGHMFDGKYRRDGRDVPMDGRRWPKLDEVDGAKVVPYVMLMKDVGAYLKSASTVRLGRDGRAVSSEPEDVASFVVYATGMNPYLDARFDEAAVDVFGIDDVGEPLPLDWMENGLKRTVAAGLTHLVLHMNDEEVGLCLPVGSI